MTLRVYLAGKIRKPTTIQPKSHEADGADWRSILLEEYRPMSFDIDMDGKMARWPEMEFLGAIITGPWFISCDHGCAHGEGSHGAGASPWVDHGPEGYCCGDSPRQGDILRLCLQAIDDSDVVFAWLDDSAAYGTIFEIGYAIAKGKTVYAAGPEFDADPCDHWLARMACHRLREWSKSEVYNAFSEMLCIEASKDRWNKLDSMCQSPIERSLLWAMRDYGICSGEIEAQHCVTVGRDRYRLDFAIVGSKICIEADGHEYHERTKEQAAHDRRRDRELQLAGWRVLRFTGAEIHRDARSCAATIDRAVQATPEGPR